MVDIHAHEGDGFKAVMNFESWRVAIMNHAPHQCREAVTQLSRHLETDEAFALLSGQATICWADGDIPQALHYTQLTPGQLYNVRRGTWHTVLTQPGTKLVVVENSDTSAANSEKYPVSLV